MAIVERIAVPTPVLDEVAESILAAARKRFEQYGYNKTTMAEIAADCRMSAANIYRYFENKLAVGAQLAGRCLQEEEAALVQIALNADLPAVNRLRHFALETLHFTYSRWAEIPRINELVQAIATERFEVVARHQARKRDLIEHILREGNAAGEFAVTDTGTTANAVVNATTLFDVPYFMHLHTLVEFQAKLDGVLQLILQGVLKR